MLRRRWTLLVAALAIVAGYVLFILNFRFGELNQDEGWYLLAARSVAEGKLPYRDFAFTQGPLFPLVYSLANPLVTLYGVAGGRMFSAALAALATLFATYLAGRLVERRVAHVARAAALVLMLINVYQSYFTTIVKTYALCAFFLAAGFFVLSFAKSRRGWLATAAAGFLLAAAAATRISSGAALAATGLCLLSARKSLGDARWIAFGLGGGVGLTLGLGPWLLVAPECFKFCLFEYHTARSAGGLLPTLIYKAGFLSRVAQAYGFALAAACAAVVWRFAFPRIGTGGGPIFQALEKDAAPRSSDIVARSIWWSLAAITLVHFAAPFPYDDYQTPLFPLFAAALAATLVRSVARAVNDAWLARASAWLLVTVLLGSSLAALASPMNMDLFVRGRDRIWWRMKEEPSLARLHRVAQTLRHDFPNAHELLTQDAYLAVEAGFAVPRGMEMGPFCYFPDLSHQRAEALHVLNRDGLNRLLETCAAPVAAFSGYGFAIACPAVAEVPAAEQQALRAALERRYAFVAEQPDFGQGFTTLRVYRLRESVRP